MRNKEVGALDTQQFTKQIKILAIKKPIPSQV
jgi:hypothetical protein